MQTLLKTASPLRLHILKMMVQYYPSVQELLGGIDDWQNETSEEVYRFRPDWKQMATSFGSYASFTVFDEQDYEECSQIAELLDSMVYMEINILFKYFNGMGDRLEPNYYYLMGYLANK